MEPPTKRPRGPPPVDDFVSFNVDNDTGSKYGYNEDSGAPQDAPKGPRAQHQRDARFDRRHAQDRPKSRHALPGHDPWVLVKTKLGRRFVHNIRTRESFWHVPEDIWPAVKEFDEWEKVQKEKEANAKWAEEELRVMRESKGKIENGDGPEKGRHRRRRSESLQREDEEAVMAELAAEAEQADDAGVNAVLKTVEPVAGEMGYDSEGSYEYVEVTDSEGEEHGEDEGQPEAQSVEAPEEAPVEFGEDDIAYQLAAMGQDYGLDPGEYGESPPEGEEGWEEGAEGLAISDEDAANLFRDLLLDYRISPFTPWDRLIADDSEASILHDDRYTVLPNMKARREVFDAWARDRAAELKEERARMEKQDPRIPYLAFLTEKATPKLYWPEFKRKFKREAPMNDRKLLDKDREKLYRDHISRLKLPESTRKADLLTLLKSIPLQDLHHSTPLDALPQQLQTHLHYISLPTSARERVISQHIATLPSAPTDGGLSAAQQVEEDKRRSEKRRREDALAARQRQVDEERRDVEKRERFARRELAEGEAEVARAMGR